MESMKVLFIAGASRSGSTLLDRLLGQIEGFFSCGELHNIWDGSLAQNMPCGCGVSFRDCGFWRNVVEVAYGGLEKLDTGAIRELRRSVHCGRHKLGLVLPWKTAMHRERLSRYSEVLARLYTAIQEVSGCRFVVDSSKLPSHGFVLNLTPGVELFVLHLVRDSRAVAYSWQRKKTRPVGGGRQDYMSRFGPTKSAWMWYTGNIGAHLLGRIASHSAFLRYEDLVSDPNRELSRILEWLGVPTSKLGFLCGSTAHFGLNHTVAGNPNRFQRGVVHIRPDREWQDKMGVWHKGLVTGLTWPLLISYGYSLG